MAISPELIRQLFYYREDGTLVRVKTGEAVICSRSKNHRYLRVGVKGKIYFLHRLIFALVHGYFPERIDHIDGNRFNNKIENLRAANQSQNCLNRKAHKNNKSGYKNVHWQANMNKWCVLVTNNSKRVCVGYFDDPTAANYAAQEYRAKYHGDFARS